MTIDSFLDHALSHHFQPYWACYCYYFDLALDHTAESTADYINWIDKRHNEFRKTYKKDWATGKYYTDFMYWLKKYVEERQNDV
jgi:hypothetical protein